MTNKLLTIGGSDPLAGGGIQTDLKTFENFQVFGLSTLTSIVTLSESAFEIFDVPTNVLEKQLDSIEKVESTGIKIGLVPNPDQLLLIRQFLDKFTDVPIVVDPVLAFKETSERASQKAAQHLAQTLFPLATLVTPNLKEAEILTGQKIQNLADLKKAATLFYDRFKVPVVMKGGAVLPGPQAVDVFYAGDTFEVLAKQKQTVTTTNGAGCAFSAAITACLSLGLSIKESLAFSKDYVYAAIQQGVPVTHYAGSVWHSGRLTELTTNKNGGVHPCNVNSSI